MFRVFVLLLLVVAVSADDSQLPDYDLGAKEKQAFTELLAYETKLGTEQNKISCKSYCVNKNDIKFTLFSMRSQNITWNASQTVNLIPHYDPSLPTQILISSMYQSEQVFQAAKLALTYGVRGNKMNVISVNWEDYAACPPLQTINYIVPKLATIISDMIKETLVEVNHMDFGKLRLTGFGVGAHAAGLTARKLPQKPARISALDPMGKLYDQVPQVYKIKKGDAKFIDVIITNYKGWGLQELVGDINFFPNGGRVQKACENYTSDDEKNSCSHHLALEYWLESVNKGYSGFVAKPANSWPEFLNKKNFLKQSEIMGENVSQKLRGNYYLEVNAEVPYSRGVNGAYLFRLVSEDPVQKGIEDSESSENKLPSNELPIFKIKPQADSS